MHAILRARTSWRAAAVAVALLLARTAAAATIPVLDVGGAGFVGQAQSGPYGQPVAVNSYAEFTATFGASTANAYEAEVRRVEERVLVDRIMWLAWASPNAQVRALATARLVSLADRMKATPGADVSDRAAHALLASDIQRFLERPSDPSKAILPPSAPPGAPIGDVPMNWLEPAPWR